MLDLLPAWKKPLKQVFSFVFLRARIAMSPSLYKEDDHVIRQSLINWCITGSLGCLETT